MKKTLTLLTLFIATATFAQKGSKTDTTTFKVAGNTIVFINSAPDSLEYDYDFDSNDSTCSKGHVPEWPKLIIDIGTNGYLSSKNKTDLPASESNWELNYGRSRSFGFDLQFKGYESTNERFYITPGLGVTWNSYHFENNIAITTNDDLTIATLDTVTDNSKYKLRATYLELPLLVGTKIGNGNNPLGIQLGVIGGLRIGSIIKQKYELGGVKHTTKIKDDFNLNPFKLDVVARISIGDIGIFAKYSTTTLFEDNKGPELYPFAVGITLSDF